MTTSLPHLAPLALLVSVPLSAQAITPLVVEGDPVAGVGNVTTIDAIHINDLGQWLVECDTDFPDSAADGVVLKSGVVFAQEGEALALPAGTSIGSFDSVLMNDAGDIGWNLNLDGATTSTNSGFFFNKTLLFQESESPAIPGLSPGSIFTGFFDAKIDDAGTSLLMASMDDPAIPSTTDRVLMLVSGSTPGALSFSVVAKEGDVLPGQTEAVTDFGTGPHDYAYSNGGHVMYVADLTGDSATNAAIYVGGTLLAQEGSPSPIAGRNWSNLASAKMDVNDSGQYVYTGSLDGDSASNAVIIKDGVKFRQEGDSPAAISPFLLTSFGTGPVCIANTGDVLWYGDWDDADTTRDTGLFLGDELLIQEGVTQVAGMTVTTVRGVTEGFSISDDGRFAIVEVEFTGSIQAALKIDFAGGTVLPMSQCTTPPSTLTWTTGVPAVGLGFLLTLDGAQGLGVFPFLGLSTQPIAGFPPCGLTVPGIGELLIDVLAPNPVVVLPGAATTGAPTNFTINVPANPALEGAVFFGQGLYVDVLGSTAEAFRASNGLEIVVGG